MNFPDEFASPTFIPPTEALYQNLSTSYVNAYRKEFGTDHLYNIDLFNELVPHTGTVTYPSF